jgi:hypothetical protein
MKRRTFNTLMTSSAGALAAGMAAPKAARAAVTPDMAAQLKTTLTPFGAERAGNADGSIPAWTGGLTTTPEGWTPAQPMPDMFKSDAKIVSINASNMAQYEDKLCESVKFMMKKWPDFRIDVYPTHRTAAAPQWVYDNTYQNALRTKPVAGGSRLGFVDAYGGIPFPIPDPNDPLEAGAQVMWNHNTRWQSTNYNRMISAWVVSQGQLTLALGYRNIETSPYYQPDGTLETYSGYIRQYHEHFYSPANFNGQELIEWQPTNTTSQPMQVWQYLAGQGRVRKAPELTYDTPASTLDGIGDYDEYYVFYGALDRYDWKLLGKREIYIPYNNNALFLSTPQNAHQPHFMNPDIVRWELHRVWVVEATLHAGERNVLPRRVFYVDEDTWHAVLGDAYDAQNNLYHHQIMFMETRPDVPMTAYGNSLVYNLQADEYVSGGGAWDMPAPYNQPLSIAPLTPNTFNPQTLGAQDSF